MMIATTRKQQTYDPRLNSVVRATAADVVTEDEVEVVTAFDPIVDQAVKGGTAPVAVPSKMRLND